MVAPSPTFTREQIIERLEILRNKLEHEGSYVRSNTVWLAIEELKKAGVKWTAHPANAQKKRTAANNPCIP